MKPPGLLRVSAIAETTMATIVTLLSVVGLLRGAGVRMGLTSRKEALLATLDAEDREPKAPTVLAAIEALQEMAPADPVFARGDGTWRSLSRPDFPGCAGRDADGNYLFSLGRASFNMFEPGDLIIAITAIENIVNGTQWDIVVAFRCHDDESVCGFMENYGECVQDEAQDNRLQIRFKGGCMRPAPGTDLAKWDRLFQPKDVRGLSLGRRLSALVARVLLGLEKSAGGREKSFTMSRAPQGHTDVLYLDGDLRVTRGNRGSVIVAEAVAAARALSRG